ncbi:tubulin--tyrsoine ligase-like protein [Angomonas deanei]|nr:tubulin--tyrsoine ligase-like protein [Angomonas deanei]|eukprot:EPY21767.1 tubulin--tyrsoine ligase-like protein [Angomonas deanei]
MENNTENVVPDVTETPSTDVTTTEIINNNNDENQEKAVSDPAAVPAVQTETITPTNDTKTNTNTTAAMHLYTPRQQSSGTAKKAKEESSERPPHRHADAKNYQPPVYKAKSPFIIRKQPPGTVPRHTASPPPPAEETINNKTVLVRTNDGRTVSRESSAPPSREVSQTPLEDHPSVARPVHPGGAAQPPKARLGSSDRPRVTRQRAGTSSVPVSAAAAYHAKGSSIGRTPAKGVTPRRVTPNTARPAMKREATPKSGAPPATETPNAYNSNLTSRKATRTATAPSHIRSTTPKTRRPDPSHTARMTALAKPEDPTNTTLQKAQTQKSVLTGRRSRPTRNIVNVSLSKYSLVRKVAAEMGFDVEETEAELNNYKFNLCWSDTVLPLTRITRFGNWQRSNHFPSMFLLCRKGHLGTTLGKMRRGLPSHFQFYPYTWTMRTERAQFMRYYAALRQKKLVKYFIVKPNSGCQGRGIVVTRDPYGTVEDLDNYIVQEYLPRPLLIEGRKFDLRVYVLLTSIREPSIFLFNDGLVRMCTEPYEAPTESNVKNTCKHLTNYAVNKHSAEYVFNTDIDHCDVGNKRNFKFFNQFLKNEGHDVDLFWSQVGFLVVKTIFAAQPQIRQVYDSCFPRNNDGYSCFEILGVDILVDHKLRPWLMEVNHTPSLATDTPLDLDIKGRLLRETWDIIDCRPEDYAVNRQKEREEFQKRNMPSWMRDQVQREEGKQREKERLARQEEQKEEEKEAGEQEAEKEMMGFVAEENTQDFMDLITERRRKEDKKLKDYFRVYPTENREYMLTYKTIRKLAESEAMVRGTAPPPPPAALQPNTNSERLRREMKDFSTMPINNNSNSASVQNSVSRGNRSRTPVGGKAVHRTRTPTYPMQGEGYKKIEQDMQRHRRRSSTHASDAPAAPSETKPTVAAVPENTKESEVENTKVEEAAVPVAEVPSHSTSSPKAESAKADDHPYVVPTETTKPAGGSPHSSPVKKKSLSPVKKNEPYRSTSKHITPVTGKKEEEQEREPSAATHSPTARRSSGGNSAPPKAVGKKTNTNLLTEEELQQLVSLEKQLVLEEENDPAPDGDDIESYNLDE